MGVWRGYLPYRGNNPVIRCHILMHSFGGGAEQVALTLARHMDTSRIQIEIGCIWHIPALAAHIPPHCAVYMPARPGFWTMFWHFFVLWKRTRRCQSVVGSLELQSIFVAALLAPGRAVAWLHKDVEGYLARKGALYSKIYRTLLGWALRRSRHIVCVSYGVLESTARMWFHTTPRLRMLYNPVDIDALRQRGSQPLPPDVYSIFTQPVILAVGRLEPEKQFSRLLRAHQILLERGLRHTLCIVGEGTERPLLEAFIQREHLEITAFLVGYRDPCPFMVHSAALALSSDFEGSPVVLVEALALGLPIVALDCPSGPREVLRCGQYGTLVPLHPEHDTATGLAHALYETLTRPPDPLHRQAGQHRAKDFAIDTAVKAWEGLLL